MLCLWTPAAEWLVFWRDCKLVCLWTVSCNCKMWFVSWCLLTLYSFTGIFSPPFSIVTKVNGNDFNTESYITQSTLKNIILSLISWQITVVFTFDLANDLLALQLSPWGCADQGAVRCPFSEMLGCYFSATSRSRCRVSSFLPHAPDKPGKAYSHLEAKPSKRLFLSLWPVVCVTWGLTWPEFGLFWKVCIPELGGEFGASVASELLINGLLFTWIKW